MGIFLLRANQNKILINKFCSCNVLFFKRHIKDISSQYHKEMVTSGT